jgi:hypothetical protein
MFKNSQSHYHEGINVAQPASMKAVLIAGFHAGLKQLLSDRMNFSCAKGKP